MSATIAVGGDFRYYADGLLTMAESWSIYRNDPATGLAEWNSAAILGARGRAHLGPE